MPRPGHAHVTPPAPRSYISHAFILALVIRVLSVLLLPQTAFQPDEFYQSLEPAHWLVFGYGHLTWEWRDLPRRLADDGQGGSGWPGWYDRVVVGGRMRGWIWPGVFALVYRALTYLGVEERALTVSCTDQINSTCPADPVEAAPRLIGALVAASTDYATYRLGMKVLGPGAGAAAVRSYLTSLLSRSISCDALTGDAAVLISHIALQRPYPSPGLIDLARNTAHHLSPALLPASGSRCA